MTHNTWTLKVEVSQFVLFKVLFSKQSVSTVCYVVELMIYSLVEN